MKCLNGDHAAIQCQAFKASLSASVKMLKVSSTLMSASRMGFFSINSATTKAAFQGYPHKAALLWICCNVSPPPLSHRL